MKINDITVYNSNVPLHICSCAAAIIIYGLFLLGLTLHIMRDDNSSGSIVISEIILQDEAQESSNISPQIDNTINKEIQNKEVQKKETQKQSANPPTPNTTAVDQKPYKPKKQDTTPSKTVQANKADKKEESKPYKPKNTNIHDAFSNIPSQKDKQNIQETNNPTNKTEVGSNNINQALDAIYQDLETGVKEALDIKISIKKPDLSGNSKKDKQDLDNWFAQIEQTLITEWKQSKDYPRSASATVQIKVDSKGKLSYLFMVTPSPLTDYNESVISFLKEMEKIGFPPTPNNKDMSFVINLKTGR